MFLSFYTVNFPCVGENRVNIQGVSTDKATKKSVHNFWTTNSQSSILTRITSMYVQHLMILFPNSKKKDLCTCQKTEHSFCFSPVLIFFGQKNVSSHLLYIAGNISMNFSKYPSL